MAVVVPAALLMFSLAPADATAVPRSVQTESLAPVYLHHCQTKQIGMKEEEIQIHQKTYTNMYNHVYTHISEMVKRKLRDSGKTKKLKVKSKQTHCNTSKPIVPKQMNFGVQIAQCFASAISLLVYFTSPTNDCFNIWF